MIPFLDVPQTVPPAKPRRDRKVRATDPVPSQDAARHDAFGPATVRVLAALVEIERTNPHRPGATANEIQARMSFDGFPPDRSSTSRRLTSLARKGFVAADGERRDGGRGVMVTVFVATAEGRAWLAAQ